MKKLISLLIGCSLGLAGAAFAEQPDEQQPPSKGKRAQQKAHATQAQPDATAAGPKEKPAKQTGATKQRSATSERGATKESGATNERTVTSQSGVEKSRKTHTGHESANTAETDVSGQSTKERTTEPRTAEDRKARATDESANASVKDTDTSGRTAGMPERIGKEKNKERKQGQGVKHPATEAGATAATTSATKQQNAQANAGTKVKKPAPQQVQQVKSQQANFRAEPKPQQVPSVTFNQNRRIEGSDHWQGAQYQVFRSYRPEWHDESWYRSRYDRVELIGGGYYYFNNGYWFPAWGFSASAQYYPYDGPIYAGQRAVPPDQVIAQTQALLQQMGYYRGEVDGLLGPLTREALTAYQADQGLNTTAAIDQPTLDSLGLA